MSRRDNNRGMEKHTTKTPPRMPPVPSGTFLRKGEIRKPPTFALPPEELELCAGGEGEASE